MAEPAQFNSPQLPPKTVMHTKIGLNISAMTEEGTKPPLCGSFSQLAWFILDEFHVLTFVSSKIHNKQTGTTFKLQKRWLKELWCPYNSFFSIRYLFFTAIQNFNINLSSVHRTIWCILL